MTGTELVHAFASQKCRLQENNTLHPTSWNNSGCCCNAYFLPYFSLWYHCRDIVIIFPFMFAARLVCHVYAFSTHLHSKWYDNPGIPKSKRQDPCCHPGKLNSISVHTLQCVQMHANLHIHAHIYMHTLTHTPLFVFLQPQYSINPNKRKVPIIS